MKSDVPPMLIQQRIRNRIYEYLGSVVEYPRNREVWSLNEMVNEWEMYVDDPFENRAFPAPAFAPTEVDAVAKVHAAWLAIAESTAQAITDEAQVMETPQWHTFVELCRRANLTFAVRGKLSEEKLLVNDV